jgi:uncharacterized Zn finger protein (UPF0148 family)
MPCFHYKVSGHPDDPIVRSPTITLDTYCPRCNQPVCFPLTKLDCPKCEEYYKAEIEHWKERYARLLASFNDTIRKIENATYVNPAREMLYEQLVELRDKIERENNLENQ